VELDLLPLGQGAVPVTGDRAEVDEHVVAVGALQEPVPLLVAEPFDCSRGQADLLPPLRRKVARSRASLAPGFCACKGMSDPTGRLPVRLERAAVVVLETEGVV